MGKDISEGGEERINKRNSRREDIDETRNKGSVE
jgi:hypothetical protein